MLRWISCRIVLIVLSLANIETIAVAQPNFTKSVISTSAESPIEGDLVDFIVELRNSGDVAADHAQLSIEWPLMGFLVDASGLEGALIDEMTRKISGTVSLPAGGETLIRLSILAPRNSAGNLLSVSVHLAHYASGTELWEHKTIDISPRRSTDGIKIGGFRMTGAGIAILAFLIVGLVVRWSLNRLYERQKKFDAETSRAMERTPSRNRRFVSSPNGITAALMIPVFFWTIFGMMAWRDMRALTAWTETTALIVGRREIVRTDSNSTGSTTTHQSGDTATVTPEFALKYEVDGNPIYSTGYDTGSSLRLGGRVLNEQEPATWKKGSTVTCWYDPDHPRDVVLRRGFGGAYLFALFPIPVFWIGISSLNQFLRSVSVRLKAAARPD